MQPDMYQEYAVINAKIKALTNERDSLKVAILEDLAEKQIDSMSTSFGKFTISNLKSWTYTSKIEQMAEDLKALKAGEESTGDATFEEKPSLRFTPAKL